MRCKVSQKRRFVCQTHSLDLFAVLEDLNYYFDQIIDMALRIYSTRHCQSDQVHLCRTRKHQGAYLDRAHTTLEVQFRTQGYTGKLISWNMRQESARIDINGMASRRLDDRHSGLCDMVAEIRS